MVQLYKTFGIPSVTIAYPHGSPRPSGRTKANVQRPLEYKASFAPSPRHRILKPMMGPLNEFNGGST